MHDASDSGGWELRSVVFSAGIPFLPWDSLLCTSSQEAHAMKIHLHTMSKETSDEVAVYDDDEKDVVVVTIACVNIFNLLLLMHAYLAFPVDFPDAICDCKEICHQLQNMK